MAKALLGYVGRGPDLHSLAELRRLRERVRDLEDEVARLQAANSTAMSGDLRLDDDVLSLAMAETVTSEPVAVPPAAGADREPALT
ncbi:MAG TPA: hypothetical protein VG708_01665 [Mycobacteriales bacterium]|nr:hypothetical protein [Mycobacteriales bacterium]